ncbi:hypothetical protein Srufu_080050 (plasmid) [Streptomyces libani subsp. rufus]|nr:hypothetical protein Srufu_080050 [Streptomyces libani subsp. rufus]
MDDTTPAPPSGPLTHHQAIVLLLYAQGLSLTEIGARHGVTSEGARHHLDNARKALGAANHAHAYALALGLGIFEPSEVEVPEELRAKRADALRQAEAMVGQALKGEPTTD